MDANDEAFSMIDTENTGSINSTSMKDEMFLQPSPRANTAMCADLQRLLKKCGLNIPRRVLQERLISKCGRQSLSCHDFKTIIQNIYPIEVYAPHAISLKDMTFSYHLCTV